MGSADHVIEIKDGMVDNVSVWQIITELMVFASLAISTPTTMVTNASAILDSMELETDASSAMNLVENVQVLPTTNV